MNEEIVYFLKADNGLIKIGQTRNIARRLESIARSSPVPVKLVNVTVDMSLWRITRRFKKNHLYGEWYFESPDLMAFITRQRPVKVFTGLDFKQLLPLKKVIAECERIYLTDVLSVCQGNVSVAARIAGMYRADFYKRLKKHNLNAKDFK